MVISYDPRYLKVRFACVFSGNFSWIPTLVDLIIQRMCASVCAYVIFSTVLPNKWGSYLLHAAPVFVLGIPWIPLSQYLSIQCHCVFDDENDDDHSWLMLSLRYCRLLLYNKLTHSHALYPIQGFHYQLICLILSFSTTLWFPITAVHSAFTYILHRYYITVIPSKRLNGCLCAVIEVTSFTTLSTLNERIQNCVYTCFCLFFYFFNFIPISDLNFHHYPATRNTDSFDFLMNFTFCREGDISLLDADAITNTTDETLTERNIVSNRILRRSGPDLLDEILNDNRGKVLWIRYRNGLLKLFPNLNFFF